MTAGEIYPVYFPIIPTETGDLKINITVISTGPSDAVIRYLKVEVGTTTNTYRSDSVKRFCLWNIISFLWYMLSYYCLYFLDMHYSYSDQIFFIPIKYLSRLSFIARGSWKGIQQPCFDQPRHCGNLPSTDPSVLPRQDGGGLSPDQGLCHR